MKGYNAQHHFLPVLQYLSGSPTQHLSLTSKHLLFKNLKHMLNLLEYPIKLHLYYYVNHVCKSNVPVSQSLFLLLPNSNTYLDHHTYTSATDINLLFAPEYCWHVLTKDPPLLKTKLNLHRSEPSALQYYNLQYISYPTPSTKLYNKNGFSLLYYQLQYLSGSPYIHECYYYQRTVASINITWTLLLLHFSTRCIDLFPSHAQFLLQDRTLVRVQ